MKACSSSSSLRPNKAQLCNQDHPCQWPSSQRLSRHLPCLRIVCHLLQSLNATIACFPATFNDKCFEILYTRTI
ncbi:hypothetical protein M5K25_012071 [Dendrobium thyrsiflorum]|uniref:Uncharacterized protein n=1 Tax=Dendrobium thyrsiflorum TaxID=117978 RepID=A0ABD0V312_DENTH